jgi:NitT/TauT family transport system permease protein
MRSSWIFWVISVIIAVALVSWWQLLLGENNPTVVYFGRPADIPRYLLQNFGAIVSASLLTALTATIAVILSGLLAITILVLALLSKELLRHVERIAAASQTIPMLVIVIIVYLVEKPIIDRLGPEAPLLLYCVVPVSLVLFFPALAFAVDGVRNIDIEIKSMLRVWDAPQLWRVRRVLVPHAMPHLLVGLRVSAAWAVLAAIITEGLIGSQGRPAVNSLGIGLMRPFSSGPPAGKTPSLFLAATLMGFAVYYAFLWLEQVGCKRFLGHAGIQERDYPVCRNRQSNQIVNPTQKRGVL